MQARLLYICLAILFVSQLQAQEIGLMFANRIRQGNTLNPASLEGGTWTVSLPSISWHHYQNGPKYADWIYKDEEGQKLINFPGVADKLKHDFRLREQFRVESFNITGGLSQRFRFEIGHNLRMDGDMILPQDLIEMSGYGNSRFIGQSAQLGPQFNFSAWNEFYAGAALKIKRNIDVGARVKLLQGLASVRTANSDISLNTHEDTYELYAASDYRLDMAFTAPAGTLDNFSAPDFANGKKVFTGNNGFGVDLGVKYKYNDQWTMGMSITDLGMIRWKTNVQNYTSNGDYRFIGLDAKQFFLGDSLNLNGLLDSIQTTFEPVRTTQSYTTALKPRVYMNAEYKPMELFTLGAMVMFESTPERNSFGAAISGQFHYRKMATVGLTYSVLPNAFTNLGAMIMVHAGPIQWYLISDNVPGLFMPLNTRYTSIRTGLNVMIAK